MIHNKITPYINRGPIITGYVGRVFSKNKYYSSLLRESLYFLQMTKFNRNFLSQLTV